MSYEQLEFASSFASEQCPEGAIFLGGKKQNPRGRCWIIRQPKKNRANKMGLVNVMDCMDGKLEREKAPK